MIISTLQEFENDFMIAPESSEKFEFEFSENQTLIHSGKVYSVRDAIVRITGLEEISNGELVTILPSSVKGMVLSIEENFVLCAIFGESSLVQAGDVVIAHGTPFRLTGSFSYLGRVVDALGNPIDGLGALTTTLEDNALYQEVSVERKAPGVQTRETIDKPLQTGYKAIDALFPIGRGQRQLIVGDRQTGKTTIAIDTILNQKHVNSHTEIPDVICIYVSIGQRLSNIHSICSLLTEADCMKYTIVVGATAADSCALQYIAPYTACALGEYFRDSGLDVLIVYDDLTKHANAYRQMSLLLRRPPGREAFPGDIFYIHARLLERSCALNERYGNGTMTALPIVETQAGDIGGFIPTNVISITDGQIYLDKVLFNKGVKPAINLTTSVSRVGARAQFTPLTRIVGSLKTELAAFKDIEYFANFGADIDVSTKNLLKRGTLLTELLKQPAHKPLAFGAICAILYSGIFHILDEIPFALLSSFERELVFNMEENHTSSPFFERFFATLPADDSFDPKDTVLSDFIYYTFMDFVVKHQIPLTKSASAFQADLTCYSEEAFVNIQESITEYLEEEIEESAQEYDLIDEETLTAINIIDAGTSDDIGFQEGLDELDFILEDFPNYTHLLEEAPVLESLVQFIETDPIFSDELEEIDSIVLEDEEISNEEISNEEISNEEIEDEESEDEAVFVEDFNGEALELSDEEFESYISEIIDFVDEEFVENYVKEEENIEFFNKVTLDTYFEGLAENILFYFEEEEISEEEIFEEEVSDEEIDDASYREFIGFEDPIEISSSVSYDEEFPEDAFDDFVIDYEDEEIAEHIDESFTELYEDVDSRLNDEEEEIDYFH